MSNKGIFTAVSGAIAQSQRLDTVANNIANSNTTGFKKDKQVFREYLTANEKMPDVIQVPKVPASVESFYDMQGGDRGYVDSAGTFTDFTQGALKPTGNALNMGLEGEGFFEVLTPQGLRFTRNGAFKVSGDGTLVTKEGFPVLRAGAGQDPATRAIQVQNRNITVSYSGEVYSNGESVGKLSLVTPEDKQSLQKVGSSMYKSRPTFNSNMVEAETAQVHQGFLEGSNVNIVQEMTDMIAATRAFESTQEAIKAFDQMNGKLVNEVPKAT